MLRVVAQGQWDFRDALAREALGWAERTTGRRLGVEDASPRIEALEGGRSVLAEPFSEGLSEIWALRVENPDSIVAGRVWTTEVVLGGDRGKAPAVAVRLLVNSAPDDVGFTPAVPGLFSDADLRRSLCIDGRPLVVCDHVETDEEAAHLADLIEAPTRRLPVIALSEDEEGRTRLHGVRIGRQLLGLAHVAQLSPLASRVLTRRWGQELSVFQGAVRLYEPGFGPSSDPFAHRLVLPYRLQDQPARDDIVGEIAASVAAASVARHRLGRDVPTFLDVRSAASRARLKSAPAGSTSELAAAREQIEALEGLREQAQANAADSYEGYLAECERAEGAETQLRAAQAKIEALKAQVAALEAGQAVVPPPPDPTDWTGVVAWVDRDLAGRVALAPAARRGLRKPEFEEVLQVVAGLRWLADVGCAALRGEISLELRDAPVAGGVRNSPCGGDAFRFDHQGRRLLADQHVKNSNTRDPRRCLRIYWAWDADSRQVVVAHLPSHRDTDAT